MIKELTYENCFPGRFLTAAHLDGKQVTVTIADVITEDLDAIDGKPSGKPHKVVLKFVGKKLELVVPKTNAYCMKMMFSNKLAEWVGKKIVLYPTKTRFGGKMVDCIRIYGSPDIAENIELTVPQGRNKAWNTVMHAMAGVAAAKDRQSAADPAMVEAWSALGWSAETGAKHLAKEGPEDYLGKLSALIDQQNSEVA